MAYAAAARCERAGAAILELRREGFLVVDFGATEEAFVVADALYSEAHVEFAHADASFPVARPPALRAWADARERTSVSGSAWSGVELGLESRAPWICFANASTRVDVYDALPAASRRVAHLDAWRTLRARAQHAEDALTDAAGASALLERSAHHLAVALALTARRSGDGRRANTETAETAAPRLDCAGSGSVWVLARWPSRTRIRARARGRWWRR